MILFVVVIVLSYPANRGWVEACDAQALGCQLGWALTSQNHWNCVDGQISLAWLGLAISK